MLCALELEGAIRKNLLSALGLFQLDGAPWGKQLLARGHKFGKPFFY
jgi:hypothetical protein